MFWSKKEDVYYLSAEESNYLCSKCLKRMFKIAVENTTINFCRSCGNIYINKEDLDKTIQFFLRKGKFL